MWKHFPTTTESHDQIGTFKHIWQCSKVGKWWGIILLEQILLGVQEACAEEGGIWGWVWTSHFLHETLLGEKNWLLTLCGYCVSWTYVAACTLPKSTVAFWVPRTWCTGNTASGEKGKAQEKQQQPHNTTAKVDNKNKGFRAVKRVIFDSLYIHAAVTNSNSKSWEK